MQVFGESVSLSSLNLVQACVAQNLDQVTKFLLKEYKIRSVLKSNKNICAQILLGEPAVLLMAAHNQNLGLFTELWDTFGFLFNEHNLLAILEKVGNLEFTRVIAESNTTLRIFNNSPQEAQQKIV